MLYLLFIHFISIQHLTYIQFDHNFLLGQNKCDLIKKDQQDKLSSGDQGLDVIYAKALNKVWSAFPLWNGM